MATAITNATGGAELVTTAIPTDARTEEEIGLVIDLEIQDATDVPGLPMMRLAADRPLRTATAVEKANIGDEGHAITIGIMKAHSALGRGTTTTITETEVPNK